MKDIELSIIIPHYNTFDKLERLLRSIPVLKENLEVIVVDDRSYNEEKYEKIKRKFKTVSFFKNNRKNKGAGTARNIGLENVKGKWVLFADADDFFLEGAFNIIDTYLNNGEDIIFFTPTSIYDDSGKKANRHIVNKALINNYLQKNSMEIKYKFFEPWSKLIKRELLKKNKIKFEEIIAANDIVFSLKLGMASQNITATKEEVYCITRSKGSLTTNLSREVFESRYGAVIRYNKILKKNKLLQLPLWHFIIRARKYGMIYFIKILFEVLIKRYKIFNYDIKIYFKSPKLLINKINEIRTRRKQEEKYHINN